MITALLHLQKCPCMTNKMINHMRCRLAQLHDIMHQQIWCRASRQLRPAALLQLVMIAQNMGDFGHRRPAIRGNLCGTAGHDNLRMRMRAAGFANGLTCLPLGLGCHRTGIDDNRILQPGGTSLFADHF